jgi:hypothetical protein
LQFHEVFLLEKGIKIFGHNILQKIIKSKHGGPGLGQGLRLKGKM